MSFPREPTTEQQSSGAWTIALVVLAVLGVAMLVCCGGLGVLGALFYTRAEKAAAGVKAAIRQPAQPPLVAPAWQGEWVAMAQLAPAYSAALDAVAEDRQVVEKLGEPIETVNESEKLFRRERTGDWDGSDETFEFELQGPKGKAVVRVVAGMPMSPGAPGFGGGVRPKSIVVVLEKGTEISVMLPAEKEMPNGAERK